MTYQEALLNLAQLSKQYRALSTIEATLAAITDADAHAAAAQGTLDALDADIERRKQEQQGVIARLELAAREKLQALERAHVDAEAALQGKLAALEELIAARDLELKDAQDAFQGFEHERVAFASDLSHQIADLETRRDALAHEVDLLTERLRRVLT